MSEFLLVFGVTLVVIVGVTLAMIWGKAPVYRPTQDSVQGLVTRALEGEADEDEWQFFLDMPIRHDPELETLRQECARLQDEQGLRPRLGKVRFKEPGQIRLRHFLSRLEQGGSKSF
ncbi:hypothetical protein [Saccharospirillum impatiens]|uniref:hypothetical protein n=1 Tax=Saccharospirillum impatiens TaxID=169438 RepID=UPI0003FDE3E1|nr:hypothetical protein [Saccharospirillum impatiens]